MADLDRNDSVRHGLKLLVENTVPGKGAVFATYWELISPHLDRLLTNGVPLTQKRSSWILGTAQLFGSKKSDQVGDLVLAAIGSLAEARKSGINDREGISKIVAGYAKALKGISPFSKGIQDFVLHVIASSGGSFPPSARGGRSLTIDPQSVYIVIKNGERVEGHFDATRLRALLAELGDQYVVVSGIHREVLFNGSVVPVSDVPYSFIRLLSRSPDSMVEKTTLVEEVFFFDYSKLRSHVISYLRHAGAFDLAEHVRTNTRTLRKDKAFFIEKDFLRCYFERVGQAPLD